MDSDVMTKEQVAAMLGCEVLTIEDKTRTGELPAVKIGRTWVYPRQALLARLNEMALSHKQDRANSAAAELRKRVAADTARRRKITPLVLKD